MAIAELAAGARTVTQQRLAVPLVFIGAIIPSCVGPSTNIGLPVPRGHIALSQTLGIQSDNASYRMNVRREADLEESGHHYTYEERDVTHRLGQITGMGMPFATGARIGTSAHNDVGIEAGWGHVGCNTRIDLMPRHSPWHVVLSADCG